MLIPGTQPTFVTGESNIQHLQTLSNTAAFLTNYTYVPFWRFIRSTSQTALTVSTWDTIKYNTVEVDPDNTFNSASGGASINTTGYYVTDACVIFEAPSANLVVFMQFNVTFGPNNPNYSSGSSLQYGFCGGSFPGGVGTDFTFCTSDLCPYYLYPNDVVTVRALPTVSCSTDVLSNANATSGWFATQFSGRWDRTGP